MIGLVQQPPKRETRKLRPEPTKPERTPHSETDPAELEKVRKQLASGTFQYDVPTETALEEQICHPHMFPSSIRDEGNTKRSFRLIMQSEQDKDPGLSMIKRYLAGTEEWPQNAVEIKKQLKKLYHMVFIGKENDALAPSIPPPYCEDSYTDKATKQLQRQNDPIEQRKLRQRMSDRQRMFAIIVQERNADTNGKIDIDYGDKGIGLITKGGRIVVPVGVDTQTKVIQAVHHSQGSFHLGENKTIIMLQQKFWFPYLAAKTRKYIKGCKQCQDGKLLYLRDGTPLGKTSSYSRERLRTWAISLSYHACIAAARKKTREWEQNYTKCYQIYHFLLMSNKQ